MGLCLALAGLISGCGGISLNSDYYDYSDVYGKSVNKQLLLNLARLSRDEPPYFLQLSGFSAQHTLTGSLGLGNKTTGVDKAVGLTELDGSASVGGTEQPIFQFVPLNGDPFAQALSSPLNSKIFYTFYDQNMPADMLARTMIKSVDVTFVRNFKDKKSSEVRRLVNDPLDLTYRDFLVWCYILRTYQLEHELTVTVKRPEDPTKIHKFSNINITDYAKAIDYSLSVANDSQAATGNDRNGVPFYVSDVWIDEPKFDATNSATEVPKRKDPSFSFVTEHPKASDLHENLTSRAIVLESLGASSKYKELNTAQFQMRTFFNVMQGLAKEQQLFAAAEKKCLAQDTADGYHKALWPVLGI